MPQTPRVSSLHVYPVKGCKGIDVKDAWFERTGKLFAENMLLGRIHLITPVCCAGLAYDRNWMVVKEKKGKFTTQRQKPKYASVYKLTWF